MAEVRALPTISARTTDDVRVQFEKLRGHVEAGGVSGMSVALTFRDGRSLTFASMSESRREMLGLLLDALLDFQKHTADI